jgi:hypothetical protein
MAAALEQFGILPPTASASMQHGQEYLPAADFFEQATGLLEPLSDVVATEVVPHLDEQRGRWHPAGYMVYSLGTHAALGSLRLHIWPRERRLSDTREGTPRDVHDHVLHIASVAVGGTYEDDIYSVAMAGRNMSDEQIAEGGLLRVFTFPDDQPSSGVLVTDGRVVKAEPIKRRVVPVTSTHVIEAGTFHAPAIPDSGLAATLSFSSPRVNLVGPHILATGSTEPIRGTRNRPVARDDAELVKEQLR